MTYVLGLRRFYPLKLNRFRKIRRSKLERERVWADRRDQGRAWGSVSLQRLMCRHNGSCHPWLCGLSWRSELQHSHWATWWVENKCERRVQPYRTNRLRGCVSQLLWGQRYEHVGCGGSFGCTHGWSGILWSIPGPPCEF